MATLFVFSGLPATGKTTLSRELSRHLRTVHLRIDTIEQKLREVSDVEITDHGYQLAYEVARDNLRIGISVIADSCNPIGLTRRAWQQVATSTGAEIINIEIVCCDEREHRERVKSREPDIPGLTLPTWENIWQREFDQWEGNRIRIDTSQQTVADSFQRLLSDIDRARS